MKPKEKSHVSPNCTTPWWEHRTYVFFFFVVLVALVYGQTAGFDFSWFDDDAILIRNRDYITDVSNLSGAVMRDAEFRNQSMELYRPLQNVSFMLDAAMGGFRPGVFHFTNIMLHLLAAWLLFLMLEQLRFARRLALAGGVLLAVHPVFAFAVGWLPARGDLLLAVSALASFLFFFRFVETQSPRWLLLHLLTFALSLLAKESAVVIIPVCALYYAMQKVQKPRLKRWQLLAAIGYAAFIIPYLLLRTQAIAPVQGGAFGLPSFFHNLPVMFEVLLKFVAPYPIVALPFYTLPATIAGIVIAIALTILLIRLKQWKHPLVVTGIVWFVGFTAPSMFYRPEWSVYIYDYIIHRSYLPLIGVIMVGLVVISHWFPEGKMLKKQQWIPTGLLLVFVLMSFSLVRVFSEPLTFWRYAVKTNPGSAFAHTYLGGALFFAEEYTPAIQSYHKALSMKPDFSEALANRGITHAALGNHPLAIADFTAYLEQVPGDTMALRYRGLSYLEAGDYASALPDLREVVDRGDRTEKVHYSLGVSMLISGDYSGAVQVMDSLLLQHPNNISYLRVGGLASLMAQRPDDAIARYLRVLTSDPSSNTLSNLGYAYWEKGMHREALDHFKRAETSGGINLSIAIGLLIAYDALGMHADSREMRKEVIRLEPAYLQGATAIRELQEKGYLFTDRQLQVLNRLFP
jgi:protein O-mannosyl-transferase